MLRGHSDFILAMQSLNEIRESLPSPKLLQQWYKLDENLNPPVYRIQNIRYSIGVLKG